MTYKDFETVGDRQKSFERVEAARSLVPGVPFIARLDGRAFHTFTRGLSRPYDERLAKAMVETTKYLVKDTHATVGYTQSDEISLVFLNSNHHDPQLFGLKVQKLCSVLAGMASAKFNQVISESIPEKAGLLPVFDCRVWSVPSLMVAYEYLSWREADATKNSVSMAASEHYSAKKLHGVNTKNKIALLEESGVIWGNYPRHFKRGTYVRRKSLVVTLTEEELARIPEGYRPSGPVTRTQCVELDLEPISKLPNPIGTLFFDVEDGMDGKTV